MVSEQIRALKRIDKRCLKYHPDKRGEVLSSGWHGVCDGPTAVIYKEPVAGKTGTFPHKLNDDGSYAEDNTLYTFIHAALNSGALQSAKTDCQIDRVKDHIRKAKKEKDQRAYAMWIHSDSGELQGLFNSKLILDVMNAAGDFHHAAITAVDGVKILIFAGVDNEKELAVTPITDEEHLSVIGVVLSLREDAYRDYVEVSD